MWQCSPLVAKRSNGHCSTTMLYRLPALVLLLLWVFVQFLRFVWLFFTKQKGRLMVDVFLRICSKVQCPMEDLCLTTLNSSGYSPVMKELVWVKWWNTGILITCNNLTLIDEVIWVLSLCFQIIHISTPWWTLNDLLQCEWIIQYLNN